MIYLIAITILMIPCSLLLPLKKVGKKNLKSLKGKNFIISCNHMSNWDPVMMDITFNKKHRFLAKKELFSNKFVSFLLRGLGAVPVDRDNVGAGSIKEILSALKKNKPLCIFPQGTRAKTVKIEDGSSKAGVAMFSIRTNTPVVPMMFDGKQKLFKRTRLLIGEPIYPDSSRKKDPAYQEEFSNLVIERMNNLIDEQRSKEQQKLARKSTKKKVKKSV